MATYGEPPRISLALWAKAPVASTVPTATVASVLMSVVIALPLGTFVRCAGIRSICAMV